jgi:hypothetical protein
MFKLWAEVNYKKKKTPWSETASELYRPSDRRCRRSDCQLLRIGHVVSVKDAHGRNLGFLDRSRYFFYQVASQLYSRG